VSIVCRVAGMNGAPLAGLPCTLSVVSEPGGPTGDVSLGSKVHTNNTDAAGNATFNLFTGSLPGTILLHASAGGLESQVYVIVQAPNATGVALFPSSPSVPSASQAATSIQPPRTGDAGLLGATHQGLAGAILALGLLGALTAVPAFFVLRRQER
jgi:hypothetical protein